MPTRRPVAVAALLVLAGVVAPVTGAARPASGPDVVVEATLVGVHAGARVPADRAPAVERRVADELGVPAREVRVSDRAVEVTADRAPAAAADALRAAGVDAGPVAANVTRATRRGLFRPLRARFAVADVEATVEPATVAGRRGVRVRSPANATRVDVRLSRPAASRLVATLDDAGYVEDPDRCERCLRLRVDGRTVEEFGLARRLAVAMSDGEFVEESRVALSVADERTARRLAVSLAAPALPAPTRVEGAGTPTPRAVEPGSDPPWAWVAAGPVAALVVVAAAVERATRVVTRPGGSGRGGRSRRGR